MIDLNVFNFDSEVLASEGTTAVYYHAAWCKVCEDMEPLVRVAETEYRDVSFFSVNTDACEEIVLQQAIRTVPTLSIYKAGKPVRKIRGPISEDDFNRNLAESLQ